MILIIDPEKIQGGGDCPYLPVSTLQTPLVAAQRFLRVADGLSAREKNGRERNRGETRQRERANETTCAAAAVASAAEGRPAGCQVYVVSIVCDNIVRTRNILLLLLFRDPMSHHPNKKLAYQFRSVWRDPLPPPPRAHNATTIIVIIVTAPRVWQSVG